MLEQLRLRIQRWVAIQLEQVVLDLHHLLGAMVAEYLGQHELVDSVKAFVHPQDKVCVKVNGIAKQNMGTNKELVLPFLEALIAAGVPAGNITVLEQYGDFLAGTRINASNVPAGVKGVIDRSRGHDLHGSQHNLHVNPGNLS